MSTNVLVVIVDDMRADLLPYIPAVNGRLRRAGTTFTNARCHTPTCVSSRMGLLTCQYAHHNGTINGEGAEGFSATDSLHPWVHDAGYYVGHIGKYLNIYTDSLSVSAKFDYWRQFPDTEAYNLYNFTVYNNTAKTTVTGTAQEDYVVTSFTSFLAAAASAGKPWFCTLAPTDPHVPFALDVNNPGSFAYVDFPITVEADVSDKPSWIQSSAATTFGQQLLGKQIARQQMQELARLSRMMDSILNLVDLTTTIVMFVSDNGLTLFEHRADSSSGVIKNDLYEPSVCVPLVIAGPGFPGNLTVTTPVAAMVDLARTTIAVTGATSTLSSTDGGNLVDLVANGATGAWASRPIFSFRRGGGGLGNNPYTGWMVRSGGMKLMRWQKVLVGDPELASTDVYEMYDLSSDPNEHTNLAYLGGSYLTQRNALEALIDAFLLT